MPRPIPVLSPAEPIRILSDLHLGHPGCRIGDVRQLMPLLEGAATVIFNGDTSEERSERFVEKGREQFDALRALCAEAGVRPIFVTGNHDPATPEHHALELCEGRVFVTHGDVIFPSVSPWSKFHADAVRSMHRIRSEHTASELERLDFLLEINKRISGEMKVRQPQARPGLWGKARTLLNEAWPPTRPLRIVHVWANAHAMAHAFFQHHRPTAQVIVIGHTHRPYQSPRKDRTVLNTGAFLALSKSTVIEIGKGTVTASSVQSAGGSFVSGKILHRQKLR